MNLLRKPSYIRGSTPSWLTAWVSFALSWLSVLKAALLFTFLISSVPSLNLLTYGVILKYNTWFYIKIIYFLSFLGSTPSTTGCLESLARSWSSVMHFLDLFTFLGSWSKGWRSLSFYVFSFFFSAYLGGTGSTFLGDGLYCTC